MKKLEILRYDGRSNADVIIDMIKDSEPGTLFRYEHISEELGRDTPTTYDRAAVASVINSVLPRVMKATNRTLMNVRMVGYKVAHAREHNTLAVRRKRRADTQMLRGIQTLQHVRLEEMTDNERHVHQGTLMIVSALWQQHRHMERRQSEIERAINGISGRVEKLEQDRRTP